MSEKGREIAWGDCRGRNVPNWLLQFDATVVREVHPSTVGALGTLIVIPLVLLVYGIVLINDGVRNLVTSTTSTVNETFCYEGVFTCTSEVDCVLSAGSKALASIGYSGFSARNVGKRTIKANMALFGEAGIARVKSGQSTTLSVCAGTNEFVDVSASTIASSPSLAWTSAPDTFSSSIAPNGRLLWSTRGAEGDVSALSFYALEALGNGLSLSLVGGEDAVTWKGGIAPLGASQFQNSRGEWEAVVGALGQEVTGGDEYLMFSPGVELDWTSIRPSLFSTAMGVSFVPSNAAAPHRGDDGAFFVFGVAKSDSLTRTNASMCMLNTHTGAIGECETVLLGGRIDGVDFRIHTFLGPPGQGTAVVATYSSIDSLLQLWLLQAKSGQEAARLQGMTFDTTPNSLQGAAQAVVDQSRLVMWLNTSTVLSAGVSTFSRSSLLLTFSPPLSSYPTIATSLSPTKFAWLDDKLNLFVATIPTTPTTPLSPPVPQPALSLPLAVASLAPVFLAPHPTLPLTLLVLATVPSSTSSSLSFAAGGGTALLLPTDGSPIHATMGALSFRDSPSKLSIPPTAYAQSSSLLSVQITTVSSSLSLLSSPSTSITFQFTPPQATSFTEWPCFQSTVNFSNCVRFNVAVEQRSVTTIFPYTTNQLLANLAGLASFLVMALRTLVLFLPEQKRPAQQSDEPSDPLLGFSDDD